jgi:hypothetical protein
VGFVAATVGTVVILALIFFLLGRKYPVASGASMRPAGEAAHDTVRASIVERENPGLVNEDVRQMLAAQNALREKRGAPEMTFDDLRAAVAEDERNRSRGRGPFAAS